MRNSHLKRAYLARGGDGELNSLTIDEDISIWASQGGGWHDSIGNSNARFAGVTAPTFSQVAATGFYAYKFDLNDEMFFEYHITHDYVPDSAIYAHVHWLADGTNVNTVKWEFEIVPARGHGQAAFGLGSPTVLTVEQASAGQYYHMIAEIADPGFSSSELEVDALVLIHVTRITNAGTDNTDGIFLLMSDLHYKSNGGPTKNKAPNFYE